MAVVERIVPVGPERVFAVLADGWSYSDWVVGTAHIRAVDPSWPAPGALIHHTVGPWPVCVRDRTVVLDSEPPRLLVLRANLRPFGSFVVSVALDRLGAESTRITLSEEPEEGPLHWVRNKVNDLALHYRNREALRRLADLAIGRGDGAGQAEGSGR